jgi:hypothetical protein
LNLSSSVINFPVVPSTLSACLSIKAKPREAKRDRIQTINPTSNAVPKPLAL